MITFFDTKEKSKEPEKCLDSQLWHACAGSMVQMSPVGSIVFYFPQGHSEHSREFVDFRKIPQLRSYIACRVSDIRFMADPETDEVFAKIKLNPVRGNETELDDIVIENEKPPSFAKTLTQSDANNGGGFSVPRYCAETIFPKLDYSADPPVQTILARDVHGETWKFRHIYRGTPRRHLLTTGWSAFVNHKKLVAGDSIVFLRTRSGELCVGIRRAKRGIGSGGLDSTSGWNSSLPYGGSGPDPPPSWNISSPYRGSDPPPGWNSSLPYGGISVFLREGENQLMRNGSCNGGERLSREKMSTNSVIDAMNLAATGREFEVVYYPRASTPEFCIKASLVKTALQIRWCSGMRFKMPFETEDSSRISWFMGTISSVQVADPIRWPDSPWRLLQVTWDEPDLLQNVKHVSPWLVELVSTMPPLHLSPFSPPWKKPKHQHPEFPLQIPSFAGAHLLGSSNTQIPSFAGLNHMITPTNALISSFAGAHPVAPANGQTPSFAGAPLRAPVDAPAGMQGARHTQFNTPLPDFHFEKLHSALFATSFPHFDTQKPQKNAERENISCLLTIGRSKSTQDVNKTENSKTTATQFVLFGQPILTEQQILLSSSGNSSSESNPQKKMTCEELDTDLENGHCKVFMDSDDVGRTLDLSRLGSYEELYQKLANMFGTENSEITNHVLWRDVTGSVKQIGNEPFGDFMKTAKRLTILTDSGSDNVGV